MELMEYKKNNRNEWIRHIAYCLSMLLVFIGVVIWYQGQTLEINNELSIIDKKSRLITHLHQQMLAVSRMQFRLLHASDYKEAHELLFSMSESVSGYVIDFNQFEQIADVEDAELVNKFRNSFKEWRGMTDELSNYAHLVSNTDLINVLGVMELNLHRLDDNSSALVIAEHNQ